jgi:hypothetical protein
MSGVAVGEGFEGDGDAAAGEFSFNDDGACISESKESLAGVRDGVTVGEEVAFSDAGLGCGFSGFAVGPT